MMCAVDLQIHFLGFLQIFPSAKAGTASAICLLGFPVGGTCAFANVCRPRNTTYATPQDIRGSGRRAVRERETKEHYLRKNARLSKDVDERPASVTPTAKYYGNLHGAMLITSTAFCALFSLEVSFVRMPVRHVRRIFSEQCAFPAPRRLSIQTRVFGLARTPRRARNFYPILQNHGPLSAPWLPAVFPRSKGTGGLCSRRYVLLRAVTQLR